MYSNLHTNQQQQLQQILNQASANTDYIDEDIGHLINDGTGAYQEIFVKGAHRDSMHSSTSYRSGRESGLGSGRGSEGSSRKQSEEGVSEGESRAGGSEDEVEGEVEEDQGSQTKEQQHKEGQAKLPASFVKLQQYYSKYKSPHSLAQVKQTYTGFAISQPSYTIPNSHQQSLFQYNTLKNVNIVVMDVGYCTIAQNFRIAIGTDDGRVAIFDKTYTKPVNIFQAFTVKKGKQVLQSKIRVNTVRWSQNLQYLAVASSSSELKIYQFKQAITIQDKSILRMQKQPTQLIHLNHKQIKIPIINIKFISQLPLELILNDQDDEMHILSYKSSFLSYKTHLSKLPVKFNNVFKVDLMDFTIQTKGTKNYKQNGKKDIYNNHNELVVAGQNSIHYNNKAQQYGTIMAIASDQYVTIALLRPYFEVIMVYDKYKHGKNIKKQGYAHVSFRREPLGILIVWDKFAHLLDFEIESLNPLQTSIGGSSTQLMPETTLAAGLITDTLVYQLSESGLKIYTTANFGDEKQSSQYKQCIYHHQVNFFQLPQGLKIQQQLQAYNTPSLQLILMLSSYLRPYNGWLFLTSNTSLLSIRIERFQQFIRNTIQNTNNWKIGLQLLHDGYIGRYKNYDNMTKKVIVDNIQEYSLKYINFLMMVIGSESDQLWVQEMTFLFNILIQTQQYRHLWNKVLPKLVNNKLGTLINALQPFVMLHRVPCITPEGLQLLFQHLNNREILSTLLIGCVRASENEVDLPHMINKMLLQHGMFEQMVSVNIDFSDYFTPFAVLLSYYQNLGKQSQQSIPINNDIQLFQQLRNSLNHKQQSSQQSQPEPPPPATQHPHLNRLRQLIAYLTFLTFTRINQHSDLPPNSTQSQLRKYLTSLRQYMQTFIPLFQSSIIPVLLDSTQQQLCLFQHIFPQLFSGQCLQLLNAVSNRLLHMDLMTDIVLGVPMSKVSNYRSYWMAVIGLYNKSVIRVEVFMGVRYLLQCGLDTKNSYNHNQLVQIQHFLQQTVTTSEAKLYQQLSNLSHQILLQFYNQLICPELQYQYCHIGYLRLTSLIIGSGHYIPVISAMMSHKAKSRKGQYEDNKHMLYNYIDQTIGSYSRRQREELRAILYENVQFFVQLGCDRLCELVVKEYVDSIDKFTSYTYPGERQGEGGNGSNGGYTGIVIGDRRTFPSTSTSATPPRIRQMQINSYSLIALIQGILHRLQSPAIQQQRIVKFDPSSQFMHQLRLKYLQLLAITGRQHEILPQVRKQNYPIDSSLQICRRFGVMDAQAYLLVKSGGEGEIASAIRLYFELIGERITVLRAQNVGEFGQYLISIIGECIKVCQCLQVGQDNFNQEWFIIAEELAQLKTNMYRVVAAYTGDLLCDVVDRQIYPLLAEKIIRREHPQGIIQYLRADMQNLDLVFLRILLNQMLKNNAFNNIMLLLTQQTFICAQLALRQQLLMDNCRGFPTKGICFLCQQMTQTIIHYNNCGHQIHPACGQDVKQCMVCACRDEKMVERQLDVMRKLRPELYARECELGEETQGQGDRSRRERVMAGLRAYDQGADLEIAYI